MMGAMSAAMPTEPWPPRGRLTAADLAGAPDDGHRYELIDGVLLVSPSPIWRHQRVVTRMLGLLLEACPDDLEVLVAPFDVRLADDTVVQPDVIVVRRSEMTQAYLPTAPVLAVEVLSPSTRVFDLHTKRERLRQAGCASYWVVDPASGHLTAWELDDTGEYVEVADLDADDVWTATRPFDVRVVPGPLLL